MRIIFLLIIIALTACGADSGSYEPELPISINELTGNEADIISEMNEYFDYELFVIDNDNPDFEISFGDLEDGLLGTIKYDIGIIVIDSEKTEGNGLRYKRVLFHELGHALGAGHSDDEESIMFHSVPMSGGTDSFDGYLQDVVDDLLSEIGKVVA